MTNVLAHAALAALLTMTASSAHAQRREQMDPVASYLQLKQREFAASDRAANARGLGSNVTALYNLLREKGAMGNAQVIGRSGDEQAQVRDALVRSIAYFLASAGVGPDDVTRARGAGLDMLQSGVNMFGASSTIYDSLTIAPIVVVATVAASEPVGHEPKQRVSFSTQRILNGTIDATFSVEIPSSNPLFATAQPDRQYLLFLSRSLGPFRKAAARAGNDGALAQLTTGYEVRSGSYAPISPHQNPSQVPVSAVDAFIEQHASFFRTQAKGGQP